MFNWNKIIITAIYGVSEVFLKQHVTVILKLGTPIILTMLSQSLLNLVDAALVGPLGEVALAAVGAGSYANFVALSLVAGLSAGVQAQVARRAGADRNSVCALSGQPRHPVIDHSDPACEYHPDASGSLDTDCCSARALMFMKQPHCISVSGS